MTHEFTLRSDHVGISSTDLYDLTRGNWATLYDNKLWQLTNGKEGAPPADLTHVWKPALGRCTEPLHRQWLARQLKQDLKTPPVGPKGELMSVMGSPIPGASVDDDFSGRMPVSYTSIDGWLADDPFTLTELKHTHGRNSLPQLSEDYAPQVQWEMKVTGAQRVILSAIIGNEEPVNCVIDRSDELIERLDEQAAAFWQMVVARERPANVTADKTIGKMVKEQTINALKPYDFSKDNSWVSLAQDYIAQKDMADRFKVTDKEIRKLVPADARLVTGGGLTAKRDARGAVRITIED